MDSHHFVPLIYQIFSRIDTASDLDNRFGYSFQAVLQNLVCKICIDHPYHGLIQLIALSNGTNVGQSKHANQFAGDEKKVQVIKQLIDRLKKTSTGYVSELLDSYKIVTDAYIALAMHPTKDWVKSRMTKNLQYTKTQLKARSLWLNKCLHRQTLSLPCVFTLPPQIRPGADYGDGDCDPIGSERIKSFADTFSITDSGIHRPKIVVCEGTKGGSYKQLVKGEGKTMNAFTLFRSTNEPHNISISQLYFYRRYKARCCHAASILNNEYVSPRSKKSITS